MNKILLKLKTLAVLLAFSTLFFPLSVHKDTGAYQIGGLILSARDGVDLSLWLIIIAIFALLLICAYRWVRPAGGVWLSMEMVLVIIIMFYLGMIVQGAVLIRVFFPMLWEISEMLWPVVVGLFTMILYFVFAVVELGVFKLGKIRKS